jgi:hypothetical protein
MGFCMRRLIVEVGIGPDHEQTFTEFTKWAQATDNNTGTTDPSDASVCIGLCNSLIDPHKTRFHNPSFGEFFESPLVDCDEVSKWAQATDNNTGTTDPSDASVCIQVVRQVDGAIER